MTYNSKSCSSLEKAYYTPTEAALRWCNLIAHEVLILERVGDGVLPGAGMFPQWPCLRVNAEKILDAIHNCEIPYGRDGKTVQPGEQVAKHRLTVRHSDLKSWMSKNYPNQKPAFLFDEVEQKLHAGITVEAYQSLQAENERLNVHLNKKTNELQQVKKELSALQGECDSLRRMVDNPLRNIDQRSETTYLNIIGGLLFLMLGRSPAGVRQSVFNNQSSIISALLGHFEGRAGISSRTLEAKFAEANKSLKSS